jgi:hypothetical protein
MRAIDRAGSSDRVRILVRSYDQPPPGPYDLILAIESLAHSPDPTGSVTALAHELVPGGTIAVVDDMPEPETAGTPDLIAFRTGWQAPVLWTAGDFHAAIGRLGLSLTVDLDLSSLCRPRTLERIRRLERLNRICAARGSADGVASVDGLVPRRSRARTALSRGSGSLPAVDGSPAVSAPPGRQIKVGRLTK